MPHRMSDDIVKIVQVSKKIVNNQTSNYLIINDLGSLSGYQDSNLGPPAPKAGALTGLRYTPKTLHPRGVKSGAKVIKY